MTSKRSKAASEARRDFYIKYHLARHELRQASLDLIEEMDFNHLSWKVVKRECMRRIKAVKEQCSAAVYDALHERLCGNTMTPVYELEGTTMQRVDEWIKRYDQLPSDYARNLKIVTQRNLNRWRRGELRIPG